MSRLEIRLLGLFEVVLDGAPVTGFESVRVRALLAYLGAEASRPQRRDHLAGLLWPGWPQQSAMTNLRTALADLRKKIADRGADPPFLHISRTTIQLNLESDCWVDVLAFEDALALDLRPPTDDRDAPSTISRLRSVVGLYRSDFLESFSLADSPEFEDWARAKGEYYRRKFMQVLDELLGLQVQTGEYEVALEHANRLIRLEPWHEAAHRHIMHILAAQGKRAEAVAQYERLRQALGAELNIEPSAETQLLLEEVRSGVLDSSLLHPDELQLESAFEPVSVPSRLQGGSLPVQLTSFIGRKREIGVVEVLLSQHRLVTLTGSGGVGKTRLSIRVAEKVLDEFKDGIWYVELAPLSNPEHVAPTVAAAIGLKEDPGRSIEEVLKVFLRSRKALVVMDNCEHLIEACARLADGLLRDCPELTLLASSREALGVAGEMPFQVQSLGIPDPDARLEDLNRYDAVNLFVTRARAALPGFQVRQENAQAVIRICRRLDGIPLALELAAARLKMLKAEQLAERLDNAFRLLTGGSRTALPRQQTLRATVDWSYQLLDEQERTLLQRLSVFSGGWTLEGAEQVCAGGGLEEWQIFDLLALLVDKSIVNVEREQGREVRYRLLEIVRQFTSEKLVDAGETETVRDRHLTYYLTLVESLEPKLRGQEQVPTMERLDLELDNLRLALEWALQSDVEAQLRLASALHRYWHMRHSWNEAMVWLEKGLAAEAATRPESVTADGRQVNLEERLLIRAKALSSLGLQVRMQGRANALYALRLRLRKGETSRGGDFAKAQRILEESVSLYRQVGSEHPHDLAKVLMNLSLISGRHDLAEEALEISKTINAMDLSTNLSQITSYTEMDPYERTQKLLDVLMIAQTSGNDWLIADVLSRLGRDSFTNGDYEKALAYHHKSNAYYMKVGDSHPGEEYFLAEACFYLGDHPQTSRWVEQATEGWLANQNDIRFFTCAHLKFSLELAQRNEEKAGQIIEEEQAFRQGIENPEIDALLLYQQGLLARLQGETDSAVQLMQDCLDLARRHNDPDFIVVALKELGSLARLEDNLAEALSLFQQSVEVGFDAWIHDYKELPFAELASLAILSEDMPRAARLYGAAYRFCRGLVHVLPAPDRRQFEADQSTVRAALGEERCDELFEQGRAMSIEEAVAFALGEQ